MLLSVVKLRKRAKLHEVEERIKTFLITHPPKPRGIEISPIRRCEPIKENLYKLHDPKKIMNKLETYYSNHYDKYSYANSDYCTCGH